MKVLSEFFAKLSPKEPLPVFGIRPDAPWIPVEMAERMDLLVSPDRTEARLVTGKIVHIIEGHWREMYLPNRGKVKMVQNQETWRLAIELIELVDRFDALVKPDQELFGSGATVHYPEGSDYAVVLNSGSQQPTDSPVVSA